MNPWDEVLSNLARRIPAKTYQGCFLGSKFSSLEGGIITIRLPYRSFIRASLLHEAAVQQAVREAGYNDLTFIVED